MAIKWPAGIRPTEIGEGIHIELWKGKRRSYSETLALNPAHAADRAAAEQHREKLKSRQ